MTLTQDPNLAATHILATGGNTDGSGTFVQRYGFFIYDGKLPSKVGGEYDLESFSRYRYGGTSHPDDGEMAWAASNAGTNNNVDHYTNYTFYEIRKVYNGSSWVASIPFQINVDTGIDLTADFHQYGVLWSNDGSAHGSVTAYFDGSPKAGPSQLGSADWDNGLYFDIFWSAGGGDGGGTNSPMQFRWIRAYQLAPN